MPCIVRTDKLPTIDMLFGSIIKRRISGSVREIAGTVYISLAALRAKFVVLIKLSESEFRTYRTKFVYELFAAQRVDCSVIDRNQSSEHPFHGFSTAYELRAAHLLVIPDGEVLGTIPLLADDAGVVISDEFPGRTVTDLAVADAKRSYFVSPIKSELVCSLVDPFAHNYFHWFLDVLTRLRELEEYEARTSGVADLLIPAWLAPWQESSLKLLAPNRRLIPHKTRHGLFRLRARTLLFPALSRFLGEGDAPFAAMDPAACRWLQNRLRTALGLQLITRNRRILISRAQASSRRILNEDLLFKSLTPLGFECYCLEGLTFREQAELFASATHIVAAHGSGLTNLLFCDDAVVCELFALEHGVRSEYFQICAALGHQYHYMICESESVTNDFFVDIDHVLRLITDGTDRSLESA
ncbi:MAG: glycosyltransferase family 61 protein [Planctomycetaceae bacterium]